MFCDKCGKAIEDGAMFCEVCGHRVGNNKPYNVNMQTNAVSGDSFEVIKLFFKRPLDAIEKCAETDYMVQGIISMVAKCVIVALLACLFRETVSLIGNFDFFWILNIGRFAEFFTVLVMLAFADACWLGLSIGCCKLANKNADVRNIIGVVGIAQLYIPIMVAISIAITMFVGFFYIGAMFSTTACMTIIAVMQYEGLQSIIGSSKKNHGLFFFIGAVCIYILIWCVMVVAANIIYGYY